MIPADNFHPHQLQRLRNDTIDENDTNTRNEFYNNLHRLTASSSNLPLHPSHLLPRHLTVHLDFGPHTLHPPPKP